MNPTNAGAERAIRHERHDRVQRIEQPDGVALLATTQSAEPSFYGAERSRIGRALSKP